MPLLALQNIQNEGKALKNYKNDYLKTDKKGYISMYDSVRWISTFTLKKASVSCLWFFLMEIIKLKYKKQVGYESIFFIYENENTVDFRIIFDLKYKNVRTHGGYSDNSISMNELKAI